MRKAIFILVSILTSITASADILSLYNQEESQLGQSQDHQNKLQLKLKDQVSKKHFVFVAGFLNEILPFQFIKNTEALKESGATAVTRIYPSSTSSISSTAESLFQQLHQLYLNGNEEGQGKHLPIVLIGHSKGGSEVVLTVMSHPELIITGIVERVVAIQPAFETPLANFGWLGEKLCRSKLSPCKIFEDVFKNGLQSLNARVTKEIFENALNHLLDLNVLKEVSESIFYVRSAQTLRGGIAPSLITSSTYLKRYGANDGLVLLNHQQLDYIGNDLGVMDADHAELLIHKNVLVYGEFALDSVRARRIKSFTRALVRSLYLNN